MTKKWSPGCIWAEQLKLVILTNRINYELICCFYWWTSQIYLWLILLVKRTNFNWFFQIYPGDQFFWWFWPVSFYSVIKVLVDTLTIVYYLEIFTIQVHLFNLKLHKVISLSFPILRAEARPFRVTILVISAASI